MKKIIFTTIIMLLATICKMHAQVDTSASIINAMSVVDEPASFAGGEAALIQFLNRNLKYPDAAIKNGVSGRVLVKFVVCEDGTLCSTNIVHGDTLLQAESLRVIRAMPKWNPATIKGKNVPMYFSLPISYVLEDDSLRRKRKKK